MTEPIGMWIGLGICAFLPFLGIGAAIRPIWIAMLMALELPLPAKRMRESQERKRETSEVQELFFL